MQYKTYDFLYKTGDLLYIGANEYIYIIDIAIFENTYFYVYYVLSRPDSIQFKQVAYLEQLVDIQTSIKHETE